MLPLLGRQPRRSAISSWSNGPTPSRASDPASASCGWPRPFGITRLEAAATRAIEIGALTYGSVRSILDHKLDRHAAQQRAADGASILHPNIRGSRYYQ